jgi:hypothetical protein
METRRFASRRAFIILAVVGLALVAIFLLYSWLDANGLFSGSATTLASFTEGDVAVTVSMVGRTRDSAWLVGRFVPTREHFHLYSKDLPLGGLGFPTLLEVVLADGVKVTGSLAADQTAYDMYITYLDRSLAVYPEGPVTLRLPIVLESDRGEGPAELSVTYVACSVGACLKPVVDYHFSVKIPAAVTR